MGITDASRMLRIVGELDRFLVGVLDPALKLVGLGREQWQVLRLLEDGEGHPMGGISQSVGLPGASTTRAVDALANRMLVYRRGDPLDRRRVLVHISGPGRETLRRVDEAMRGQTASLLDRFNSDERQELVKLLEKLLPVAAD